MLVAAVDADEACPRDSQCRGVLDWRLIPGLDRPVVLRAWPGEQPEPCVLCQRHEALLDPHAPRRYFNTRGDYDAVWFVAAPEGEDYFVPLLDAPLHLYRARHGDGGGVLIDQSALFARDPPPAFPRVGELVHDFLRRKHWRMAPELVSQWRREHLVCASVALERLLLPWREPSDPLFWSPASRPVLFADAEGALHVDLRELRRLVDREEPGLACSDAHYFRACQLHDMVPERAWTEDELPLSELLVDELVTESAVAPHAQQWFVAPASESCLSAPTHRGRVLRYVLRPPRAAWVRPLVTRTTHRDAHTYDTSFFELCAAALLCALLGNYPWQSRRLTPTSAQRRRLRLFFGSAHSHRWTMRFFGACPSAVGVVLRQMAVHQWRVRPWSSERLARLVDIAALCSDTERAVLALQEAFLERDWWTETETLPAEPCALHHLWSCGLRECGVPCRHALLSAKRIAVVRAEHLAAMRRARSPEEVMDACLDLAIPDDDDEHEIEWRRPGEAARFDADRAAETASGWSWAPTPWSLALHRTLDRGRWERQRKRKREKTNTAPRILALSRDLAAAQRAAQQRLYASLWSTDCLAVAYCAACRRLATPLVDARGRHMGLQGCLVSCETGDALCETCRAPFQRLAVEGALLALGGDWLGFCGCCGYLTRAPEGPFTPVGVLCAACDEEAAPRHDYAAEWRERVRQGACAVRECARRPGGRPLTVGSAHWLAAHGYEFARRTRHGDVFVCARHFDPRMLRLSDPGDDEVDACYRNPPLLHHFSGQDRDTRDSLA